MRRGIILSLMLHLGAFFVVWVNVPDLFPEPEVKPIKIRMVSAPDVKKTTKKEVKKVKTQQSAAPKKAPEPKKKEVKQTKPKNPTKVVKAEPKKTEPKKAPPEPKPEKPKQEEVKKAENKPRPEKLDKTPDKKNVIKDKSEDAKTVEKDDFLAALDFVDDLEDKQSALTQGAKKTEATTLDLAAQAELAKLKEHIENPLKVISEIKRVLKKNGLFYCTVPFLQGYHADPYDFQRFTMIGMRKLLDEYEIIQEGISSGPFSSIAWIVRDLLTIGKKKSVIYNFSRVISSLLSFPISLIDYIFPKTESFRRNASEYYYLARPK